VAHLAWYISEAKTTWVPYGFREVGHFPSPAWTLSQWTVLKMKIRERTTFTSAKPKTG
jgi:hypothetical protein